PKASVVVMSSATPSSAAKTSQAIHDPIVTPAGAAATNPRTERTYATLPRPYIDSNSAAARRSHHWTSRSPISFTRRAGQRDGERDRRGGEHNRTPQT